MIDRELAEKIRSIRGKFPVITVTGPRQSGKTTLIKSIFKDLPYVNLEDLDTRILAQDDPRGFLKNYPDGAVLDEVQNVPDLFSYLQGIVDEGNVEFVLSGSQNFKLQSGISQSLAGRTAVFTLLPVSKRELEKDSLAPQSYEQHIFNGGYPRLYENEIDPRDFYPAYIATYVEKDVRQIQNIENLNNFTRFIKLCAGRVGQLLNYQSLAGDAGISTNTAKSWISVLEASYILYRLPPYYRNFNKRLIKAPKIYFYDTGLACSLLGIENIKQVSTHYLVGGLFENFIQNQYLKHILNHGRQPNAFYWQDRSKKEIDLLIEQSGKIVPVEIKSGYTKHKEFLKNPRYFKKIIGAQSGVPTVIYGGDDSFTTTDGRFLSWRNCESVFDVE